MTVAVSCNLSDGVILGVDSAVTVPSAAGVVKVYENAEKLFQLADRPIGVATYGLGALGMRSIGTYLREFELKDPNGVVSGPSDMAAVAEGMRGFFTHSYLQELAPLLEQQTGKKFDEIPPQDIPVLGLVIGGFSPDEYLSEVWEVIIPVHRSQGNAQKTRGRGDFGTNWFALFEPIRRYIKGWDLRLLDDLVGYFVKQRGGIVLTPQENQDLQGIMARHEYQIPFAAMPMEEGVQHVRFLVDLVISHHRYVVGAPVVGGRAKIGKVTYRGERFEILEG